MTVLIFFLATIYFYYSYSVLIDNAHPEMIEEFFEVMESSKSLEGIKVSCKVILQKGVINYGEMIKLHKYMFYASLLMGSLLSLFLLFLIKNPSRSD